jgi:hypothetical protein
MDCSDMDVIDSPDGNSKSDRQKSKKSRVKITVEGHPAVLCCRRCDRIMNEEPGSPKPRGYFLFKCSTCDSRIGIAVIAIAAQKS